MGHTAKMIAHRGRSGMEKENSMAAFVAAGNRSFFGIETDIHETADGRFIVIHDDTTGRVAGVDLPVEASSFEELRKVRLLDTDGQSGRCDLCLPSLSEYLGICRRYEKKAVLELKNHFRPEAIRRAAEEIGASGWLEQVIFISFDLENLVYLRGLLPKQPLQFLTTQFSGETAAALEEYGLGLDIHFQHLTPDIVQLVHSLGGEVNCWTVNDPAARDVISAMGADYITSNILE